MPSTAIDQISAHLEFLGYKVSQEDESTFFAEPTTGNDAKPQFTIHPREDGIFFLAGFPMSKAAIDDPLGFLRLINAGNSWAYVARFVWDVKHPTFFAEAFYPTLYDKGAFAAFITQWLSEIVKFFSREQESTRKYFTSEKE